MSKSNNNTASFNQNVETNARILWSSAYWAFKITWSTHALLTAGLIGLAWAQSIIPVGVMLVVMPVALYFLVLGLLASRSRPQLLSARVDFVLLSGALSPLILVPAWSFLARWPGGMVAILAVFAAIAVFLSPRAGRWVLYGLSADRAAAVVGDALATAGWQCQRTGRSFHLADGQVVARVEGFGMLPGATIILADTDACQMARFQRALAAGLSDIHVQPPAPAVALLLLAMAMLTVPLTLMAGQTGQIVRLITDLLK